MTSFVSPLERDSPSIAILAGATVGVGTSGRFRARTREVGHRRRVAAELAPRTLRHPARLKLLHILAQNSQGNFSARAVSQKDPVRYPSNCLHNLFDAPR